MSLNLFHGQKVRLTAVHSLAEAEVMARWTQDSEFARLLDSGAHRPLSAPDLRERYSEFKPDVEPDLFLFMLRPLAEDTLLGFVGLEDVLGRNGNAWVGIGLGERAYWGRGYGTEAMRLVSRYAFTELGLNRLSLTVFEYNPRAVRWEATDMPSLMATLFGDEAAHAFGYPPLGLSPRAGLEVALAEALIEKLTPEASLNL